MWSGPIFKKTGEILTSIFVFQLNKDSNSLSLVVLVLIAFVCRYELECGFDYCRENIFRVESVYFERPHYFGFNMRTT